MTTTQEKAQVQEQSPLYGQVAIVTGASGGVGNATCRALARAGVSVVAVDLDQQRVQTLVEELAGSVNSLSAPLGFLGLKLDVRSESDMQEMAEVTLSRFGRIDILVSAAGILRPRGTPPRMLAQMSTAEWDAVVDTNLKGVFLSNRAVLPTMIHHKRGQIVNISSVSGRQGRAYDSAYCASKFAIIGLSESLTEEVRAENIRVHIVLPDAVDTPMWDQNGPIPRPKPMLSATRVADFIVYLLALPEDTLLVSPVIAPFQRRRRVAAGSQTTPGGSA